MHCHPVALGERAKRPRRSFTVRERTPAEAPDEGAALVLVVDDEPDAIGFLQALLTAEGFQFVSASSGAEALMICRERRPDLVILDVMMPGMTGFELCDLLRADVACRDIPIIVYSGHDTKPYSNTGLYDVAFIKPADPEDLLVAVRALLT